MVEYVDYNSVFGVWGKIVFKLLTSGPFFFLFFPSVFEFEKVLCHKKSHNSPHFSMAFFVALEGLFEFTKTKSRTKILHLIFSEY